MSAELRAALRRGGYLSVFIDGRNEHGSHVLTIPGDAVTDHELIEELLADQGTDYAEKIISEAEALGHATCHCVVTVWRWVRCYDDHARGGYWEYERVCPLLSEAMHGSPEEQRAAIAEGENDAER